MSKGDNKIPTLDVAINALRAKQGAQEFDSAVKQIQHGAGGIDQAVKRTGSAFSGFGNQINSIASGLIGLAAVYKTARFFQSTIKEAMEGEKALTGLAVSLKVTGEYSSQTMRDFQDFAQAIQNTTTYSDENILSTMKYINTLGVTSENLQRVTKNAIALSSALGIDLTTAGRYAVLVEEKEFTALGRLIPALRNCKNETEALAAIQRVLKVGFEEAGVDTAVEEVERLKNKVSDLKKGIGEDLLPIYVSWLGMNSSLIRNLKLTHDGIEEVTKITGVFTKIWALSPLATMAMGIYGLGMKELPEKYVKQKRLEEYRKTPELAGIKEVQPSSFEELIKGTTTGDAYRKPTEEVLKANQKLNDEIKRMTLSAYDYKMGLLEEEIKEFKKTGLDKELIIKYSFEKSKEYATEAAEKEADVREKATKKASDAAEKIMEQYFDSINNLDDLSLREKIQNLEEWGSAHQAEIQLIEDGEKRLNDAIKTLRELQKGDYTRYLEELQYNTDNWSTYVNDKFGEVARSTESSLSNAFVNMTSDVKNWKDALKGFFIDVLGSYRKMLADMVAQQMMQEVMNPLMKALGGALGGAFGGMFGGAGTTFVNPMAVMGVPSAKGNIFHRGLVTPFAKGDILSRPTIFPMSNGGLGLAGEAGKEAIMPLTRDAGGRLGVRTEGQQVTKTPIKIINVMDQSQVQEYLNSADGERQIVNIMRRNGNQVQQIIS